MAPYRDWVVGAGCPAPAHCSRCSILYLVFRCRVSCLCGSRLVDSMMAASDRSPCSFPGQKTPQQQGSSALTPDNTNTRECEWPCYLHPPPCRPAQLRPGLDSLISTYLCEGASYDARSRNNVVIRRHNYSCFFGVLCIVSNLLLLKSCNG